MISFDEFSKLEMKVGKILSAEPIPTSNKLLKLSVDFGLNAGLCGTNAEKNGSREELKPSGIVTLIPEIHDVRQILSGIAKYFPLGAGLVGKKCMFVTNLEPRLLMGTESNGMILAVSTEDGKFSLLEPDQTIPEGTKAR